MTHAPRHPRIVALAVALLVATCLATIGRADGATGNTVVSMTVPSATTLDTTACAADTPGVTNFGTVLPGSVVRTGSDCRITFGSSNDSSSLRVAQSDGTGTAMSHPTDAWTRTTGATDRIYDVGSAGGTSWALAIDGTMRRSTDAGLTWPFVSPALTGGMRTLSAATATAAWSVGSTNNQVWRTVNGTDPTPVWSRTATDPTITAVRGVAAADDQRAWVVGSNGMISSTVNGGGLWTPNTSPVASTLTGIRRLDDTSLVTWGASGVVVVTSDGTTWRNISISGGPIITDVWPIDDDRLVAIASGGIIITTNNATATTPTWTYRTSGTSVQLVRAYFANALDGWVTGADGVLTTTHDGGATWAVSDIGTSNPASGISSPAPGVLLAGGDGFHISRSSDGGATWDYVVGPTNRNFNDVSMTTDRTGWRVGSDGRIERTTDGGTSWNNQPGPTTLDLFGVHAFDPLHVVAVGREGVSLVTTNGGATWTATASNTVRDLYEVDGTTTRHAWAVGDDGVVIGTRDAGATWEVQHSGTVLSLLDVTAMSSTVALAVGRNGSAFRTSDGVNWVGTSLPVSNNIHAVTSLRGTTIAMASANSGFFRTVDGGATWTTRAPVGTLANTTLAMSSLNEVMAFGTGFMAVSHNGGATWSGATAGGLNSYSMGHIDVVDRNTYVMVGSGGVSGVTGSTGTVADYTLNATDWYNDGTEAFGMCLRATTANTSTWTVNPTCDQTADGAHWRGVPASTGIGSEVVRNTTSAANLTADFRFGLRVAPDEAPGELSAGITFEVVAPA